MTTRRNGSHGYGEQVMDKTAEIGGNLKDIGQIVRDAVDDKFHELYRNAMSLGAKGRDKAVEMRDDVACYVESRPLKSVLIAAGAGDRKSTRLNSSHRT